MSIERKPRLNRDVIYIDEDGKDRAAKIVEVDVDLGTVDLCVFTSVGLFFHVGVKHWNHTPDVPCWKWWDEDEQDRLG